MSRRGDHVGEVTSMLAGLKEDGSFVPPSDDDYQPDIDNDGTQEIDTELEDVVSEDQEIDQEVDTIEENDEVEEESAEIEDDTTAEERDVETINELAQFLEVDEAQLYDIQIPMGDGLDPISIGSLKDGYTEIERQKVQLQNDRAALNSQVEQYKQNVQNQQQMPEMNEEMMQSAVQMEMIKQQYAATDWEALEESDPTKAMLYQQKLERAFTMAQQNQSEIIAKQQQIQKDNMDKIKAVSRNEILNKIPEWKNPQVFQKEGDLIAGILQKYGYTPNEIENVYDPRLSVILRDFMKLKIKADKADTTIKKLRITPKKLPGSAPKTKKMLKNAKLKKTMNEAMNSKNIKDKVSAVSDLLNNS